MTPLVSQKAFGKNFCVNQIWFCHTTLIARLRYNFASLENTVAKNKYDINSMKAKFYDARWALYKAEYQASQPENAEIVFTVIYVTPSLGQLDMTLDEFREEDIPQHHVDVIKRDGVIIWDKKNKYTSL